jgi:multiple sugar transport system substrate-binding protein
MKLTQYHPYRRSLATQLTMVVCLAIGLASCGGSYDPPQETSAPATPTATLRAGEASPFKTRTPKAQNTLSPTPRPESDLQVDLQELEGTEVEFWHVWPGETGQTIKSLTDEFNRSNQWGISAEASYQGNFDQLSGAVSTSITTGAFPDLVIGYTHQAQSWDMVLNTVVDLEDYVNDPRWGLDKTQQEDFISLLWEHERVDGKRYGIPAQGSAALLYYNLTWARELGYDSPPATSAQFRRQACAAAQANMQDDDPDNDHTGGWIIATDYATTLGWIYAFGGQIVAPGGDGYRFDQPEVEAAFSYLRRLLDDGCAWLSENPFPNQDFAARRGLFAADSLLGVSHQEFAFEQLNNSDQWTVIPFPSPSGRQAIDLYAPAYIMLKSTPGRQLAAWLYIKWLLQPDNQARIAQVGGSLPTRLEGLQALEDQDNGMTSPWSAAVDLLPVAHGEPRLASWETVRWAVQDAATQLFRYYFSLDRVPTLVELLDDTAAELHEKAQHGPGNTQQSPGAENAPREPTLRQLNE